MAINEVPLIHLVSRTAGLSLLPGKNTPLPTIAPTESTIDRDPPPVTRGVDCRDSSPISRKPSPHYVRNSNGELPPSRYWGGEMALDIDIHKYLYIYIYSYLNLSLAPIGVTPPSAPPFFWPFLVRQMGETVSARKGPRGAQLRGAEKPVAPRGISLRRRGRPSFRRGRNGAQTRGAAPEKKRRGAGGRKKSPRARVSPEREFAPARRK